MSGHPAGASRGVDTFVTCWYAQDPSRPDCEHRAVVAYGTIALCASCDKLRSTVGKGMVGRILIRGRSWSALLAVEAAVANLRDAQAALAEAVGTARMRGHSWGELATAIGVSRQAVQQRFGTQPKTGPGGGDATQLIPTPSDMIRRTRSDINA